MHVFLLALSILSGLSFVLYGYSCLFSAHMRKEFVRFGVSRYRVVVGTLELLGGCAQLSVWVLPSLALWASGGLALLMGLGVLTRIKIGDRWLETAPAILYMLLNVYLLFALVRI